MKQRVITGVIGAIGILFLLWLGSWWYSAMLLIIATVAYIEYSSMIHLRWKQPPVLLGLFVVWFFILSDLWTWIFPSSVNIWSETNRTLLGLIFFLLFMILNRNRFDIHQLAFLYVGTIYIGLGFSYMIQTIWMPDGFVWSLFVILVIWANDTGAYLIGRKYGKRKLSPHISPNKTIEGSLGGILFGVSMSLILFAFMPQLGVLMSILWIGFLISIFGQIGDLVESAIKRSTGLKDTGKILPGHGGILDRFDSLLITFILLHLIKLP